MKKRLFSWLLTLAMLLSMVPSMAFTAAAAATVISSDPEILFHEDFDYEVGSGLPSTMTNGRNNQEGGGTITKDIVTKGELTLTASGGTARSVVATNQVFNGSYVIETRIKATPTSNRYTMLYVGGAYFPRVRDGANSTTIYDLRLPASNSAPWVEVNAALAAGASDISIVGNKLTGGKDAANKMYFYANGNPDNVVTDSAEWKYTPGEWYTYKFYVDATAKTVTTEIWNSDASQKLASRTLFDAQLYAEAFHIESFYSSTTVIDYITVKRLNNTEWNYNEDFNGYDNDAAYTAGTAYSSAVNAPSIYKQNAKDIYTLTTKTEGETTVLNALVNQHNNNCLYINHKTKGSYVFEVRFKALDYQWVNLQNTGVTSAKLESGKTGGANYMLYMGQDTNGVRLYRASSYGGSDSVLVAGTTVESKYLGTFITARMTVDQKSNSVLTELYDENMNRFVSFVMDSSKVDNMAVKDGGYVGLDIRSEKNTTNTATVQIDYMRYACLHANTKVLPAVELDCGVAGKTEGLQCNDCGATLVDQVVTPAPDHNFVLVEDECVNAGIDTAGKLVYECTLCGDPKVVTIPMVCTPVNEDVQGDMYVVGEKFPTTNDGVEGAVFHMRASEESTEDASYTVGGEGTNKYMVLTAAGEGSKAKLNTTVGGGGTGNIKFAFKTFIADDSTGYASVHVYSKVGPDKDHLRNLELRFDGTNMYFVEYDGTPSYLKDADGEVVTVAAGAWHDVVIQVNADKTATATLYDGETVLGVAEITCFSMASSAVYLSAIGAGEGSTIVYFDDMTLTRLPGHAAMTSVVTDPTCTENGYTTHTCGAGCGYTYTDTVIEATGHDYVAGEVVEPTCTEGGYTIYNCSGCDATENRDETDPIAHTYDGAANGYVKTEAGHAAKCSCGAVGEVEGHTPNIPAATVGRAQICTVCEYVMAEALTHTHIYDVEGEVTKQPTCTKKGEQIMKCACGEDEITIELDIVADAHKWDNGVVTDPTCTVDGYTTYTCEYNAEHTMTSKIDATGHAPADAVIEEGVASTCTVAGYNHSVVYCSVCGEEISRTKVDLPLAGHTDGTPVKEKEIAGADCKTQGTYDMVTYCTVCGEEVARETLPGAYGDHNYVNGYCSVCGETQPGAAFVAQVGEKSYLTLADAIAAAEAGETVTLLDDTSGSGVVINKDVTIEFGSYTYTFTTPAVGSSGTESNGFQILKDNTVTLKNGTLTVDAAYADQYYMLIQNYADLTVTNMTLDGTNLDKYSTTDGDSYVLSNNSGDVVIDGATNITANNDGDKAYAFDSCKYGSYTPANVTVNTTGTIAGDVEVTGGSLALEAGTVNGEMVYTSGTVTKEEAVTVAAPEGYKWVEGVLTACDYVAEADGVKYETLAEAIAEGGEVKLIADVALTESIYVGVGNTVTFDLNGKKLTGPDDGRANYYAFIVDGGNLTFKDSVSTGELYAKCYGIETKSGTFTMESGKITATRNATLGSAVVNYGGTVVIKGGELSGNLNSVYTGGYFADAETTIAGGTLTGPVTVKDWADKAFTETVKSASASYEVIEGYEWTQTDDGYILSAHVHTEGEIVVENEVAADCINAGSYDNVVYCSACGEELSRETITVDATGHRWSSVVTTPATCTVDGYITITCGNCGVTADSRYDDDAKQYLIDHPYFNLAAKGHTEGEIVVENEVAADCTNAGSYDNVIYCSVCGEELSRETITVEALGHTEEIIPGYDATETEPGMTEGKKCSVCGEILVEQTEIPVGNMIVDEYKATGTAPEKENMVFAGWYTDATCTTPYTGTTGTAYAKFVNKAVLTTKVQITAGTAYDSETTNVRFLSTVDCLNYKAVGFTITLGDKTVDERTTSVFSTIVANTGGDAVDIEPTRFDQQSEYFITLNLKNVPNSVFGEEFKVNAYWITEDGTKVEGDEFTFTVNQVIEFYGN